MTRDGEILYGVVYNKMLQSFSFGGTSSAPRVLRRERDVRTLSHLQDNRLSHMARGGITSEILTPEGH